MSLEQKQRAFIAGGKLLTNLEEYSIKLQEETENYADAIRKEIAEEKIQAEQELEKTRKQRQSIDDEISQIVDKARIEAEKILKNAQDQGYKSGYSQAEARFNENLDKRINELDKILTSIKGLRKNLYLQMEQEIESLAMLMAKKLIINELKTSPDFISESLKKLLPNMVGLGKVKISLSTSDYDYIQEHYKNLQQFIDANQPLQLLVDNKLTPGSLHIESDYSIIKYNLDDEFNKLKAGQIEQEKKILSNQPIEPNE